MPRYVIERQFLVPIFEHVLVEATDLASARRAAIDELCSSLERPFDNLLRRCAAGDYSSGC